MSFVAGEGAPTLLKGTPLESLAILDGDQVLWKETGEVRHVTRAEPDEGPGLKYGIQFGISRMSIQSVSAPEPDFARRGEEAREARALREPSHVTPEFIRASLMAPHVIRQPAHRARALCNLAIR